jgi:hypothetical protein
MLEALKWTLETKSASAISANNTLTSEETPSTTPVIKSVVAADLTKLASIQTRQLIPTLDVKMPVTERQNFLKGNQNLHVLIVDDNDINLKVCEAFSHSYLLVCYNFVRCYRNPC